MVSIIVPVYNVEQYIGECIESVLNQTYKNWELILVVDGATDNSSEVCNYYKGKDSRIKVIEKANGGVSSARNAGIRATEGNYIMFLDGDDWIEPDTLESMVGKIIENQVDACYCGKYFKDSSIVETGIPEEYRNTIINSEKSIELHIAFEFVASPCFSLTKRSKVDNVFFNEDIHAYEDWEYNFRQLNQLDCIYILDKAFYRYRTVKGSASKSELNERKLTCFKIPDEVKKYILKNQLKYDKELVNINIHLIYHMLVILANEKYTKKTAKVLCKKARSILREALKSDEVSSKNKLYMLITSIHPRLFYILYKLKYRV